MNETLIIGKFADLSMKVWNVQTSKEQKLNQCHVVLLKSISASPSKITQYFATTDSKFAFMESNGIYDLIEIIRKKTLPKRSMRSQVLMRI